MSQGSATSAESLAGASFSQRIVSVDSYTSFPLSQVDTLYSTFRGTEVKRVPVIRIYGATPKGQKTCTHIHGVFPYLYVLEEPGLTNLDQRLALALDRGISAALNYGKVEEVQHVFKIVRVNGRTFYGYKSKDDVYLKIYFYSPIALSKATDLLQSGSILNHRFQPHEAHIPYVLQFFMDFKLYGMNFIHFSRMKFRGKPTTSTSAEEPVASGTPRDETGIWDLTKLPHESFLPSNVLKKTRCELEIDVMASEIIISQSSAGKNPGIEAIWMDERERRRMNGLADWAQVPIPDSQPRPAQSYIYKREAELMKILQAKLQHVPLTSSHSHTESPNTSQEDNEYEQAHTPSSQVLIDRVDPVNFNSQDYSLSWDARDEDMVALLEEMAREREAEESQYDMNSILGSQVLTDLEEDPYLLSTADEGQNGEPEVVDRNDDVVEGEASEDEDNIWTQGFLSDTLLVAALEESENRERQEKESGGGFMMDQTDGQQDGSGSSDESDDTQLPDTPPDEFLARRIRPTPVRPDVSPGSIPKSDSDSEIEFLCETKSPKKLPPQPVSAPDSPEIHDVPSSESDSDTTPDELIVVEDEWYPGAEDEDVEAVERAVPGEAQGVRGTIPISAEDQEEAEAVEGNVPDEGQEEGDAEVAIRIPVKGEGIEDTVSLKGSIQSGSESDDGKDNGITSFYEYPGDPSQPLIPSEDEAEDGSEVQSSSQQSITSFYKYSSDEEIPDTSTEDSETEGNRSFQDVLCSQPDMTDDSWSSDNGDGRIDRPALSDFARQRLEARHRQALKVERNKGEPFFRHEVFPLKRIPNSAVVMAFMENPENSSLKRPPACFQYFKEMAKREPGKRKDSPARQKLIQDLLIMQRGLPLLNLDEEGGNRREMITNFVWPLQQPIIEDSSKRNYDLQSESEEDEVPGPVKPFGFGRFGDSSDGEESQSEMSDDDRDTVVPSPMSVHSEPPSPMPPSSDESGNRNTKPKSALRNMRKISKKRRLTWEDESDSSQQDSQDLARSAKERRMAEPQYPRLRLNDSELDSMSFTSHSPGPSGLDTSNFQNAKALHECQFLTTLSMEVHCSARDNMTPDPRHDAIQAIFFTLQQDNPERTIASSFGCFMVTTYAMRGKGLTPSSNTTNASGEIIPESLPNEMSLILKFIAFVQNTDPDILVGYEVTKFSWGYLIERGTRLGLDMSSELSRLLPLPQFPGKSGFGNKGRDEPWNEAISGRIVLNLWRLLRHEITVTSYTFENAVFQILHERTHLWTYRVLDDYWQSSHNLSKVMAYFRTRVEYVIRIIEKLDLVNRTSELARLFGIQFFEVLSRGSQFRVESMMLRLAKPANLIPPSPNPRQRGSMRAPEYLPLIMEPESKFYKDPVAVLDFQSLYPSMMMAYNYCFSTCLGRVEHLGEEGCFQLGCLSQAIPPSQVASLLVNDLVHISPCGVAFVKSDVRKGILGSMLEQILDTRQMVKRAMKKWMDDVTLEKVLDSRQLGLKLIANVTYGYTSANFSGRMPCVEIADSVVSKGRETLQRAIDYVKENEELFEAKVVYGDTDSLFLHFPGKTRAEAFVIAQRIVDDVTAMNPKPVKLKLEKVYQPCILQTKKRYVGFSYETPEQTEPKYEAKGIETVRRDGCPATAKILEGTLKTLFVTQDEAMVRKYVQEQFRKIFMGRVSLNKYTFAREYRGRDGYKPTAVVPALEISKKLSEKDPRSEPLPNQRVPYIVVYGNPGLPLIQLIRRPAEFIGNPNLRLNAHYYIEKAIMPALNRCLALAGFCVGRWYAEMPRKYLKSHYTDGGGKKGTIDQYFKSESCVKCECRTVTGFCETCFSSADEVRGFLRHQEKSIIDKYENTCTECRLCSGETKMICVNMDCPVKHRFLRYDRDYQTKLPNVQKLSRRINTVDW